MVCNCVRCGKEFETSHKSMICSDCKIAKCVICGNEFELKHPYTQQTCSSKCRGIYRKQSGISKQVAEKAKQTVQMKYGIDNVSELQRFKKICKWCGKEFETTSARREYCEDKHYGPCPVCGKQVEIKEMYIGPQACSEECRQVLIKNTCLEKYGSTTAVNSEHAKELAKQTCLEKYGVDHYSKSAEYKKKVRDTMLERYGVTSALKNPELLAKLQSTCEARYGVPFACMTKECRSSYHTVSKINLEFKSLLDDHDIVSESEFRLERYSYDFRVGSTLIELNPSITHNSAISIFPDTQPLSKDYHINKTKCALKHGYRCIHVWDWDDWLKIIELLEPKTTVYARKCDLRKLDTSTASKFTAKYHLSGSCYGQIVNYGLYYDGELIEVLTLGKPRYNKQYDFEILRLCSKSGLKIIGGASKLFHAFKQAYPNASVISYCDASKFSGQVYAELNMTLTATTDPTVVWSKDSKYVTNNLLLQRGYDQLFGTDYGKGTSNEKLMLDNKWLPVYDCGQYVYTA